MENSNENIKAPNWEELVDRFFETKVSMAEFCRQHNLSYDHFRTVKIRLEAKRLRKMRAGFAKVETAAASTPTKSVKSYAQLPDPEWVAAFVRSLLDRR